ncbi:hypothetical protein Trco_001214 [Trichoderma cornu-damae]|uniref:Uncharacterized protein n=1 Tax=Trichoderma cornu-damae TaxID=654480 RepID=A0A9P8TZR2_9HYPO|nr:hypothetical protein Trco_001214 [Trichoderma cornu-damae]
MPVRSRGEPGTEKGLEIFCSVEQVAEALGAVSLVDALTSALAAVVKHEGAQLVDGILDPLHPPVHNVDAVVAGVFNQLLHVAPEAGEVGGDARHTHDRAFGWSVAPWLVIRREDAQVAAAHKVIIVQRQHGVGRVQKLRVEDDLDAVRRVVEQLHPANLVQDGIFAVVEHVVSDNRREPVPLHGKETPAQENAVLAGNELLLIRHWVALVPLEGPLEDAAADGLLDNVGGVLQGLDDGLALEGLDGERCGLSGHDDEGHDGHLAVGRLEPVVESRERLDEHVDPLVPEFIPPSGEEVQRVFRFKVVVAVKVAPHEVVDLLLGLLVQVLEFMNRRELCDVEAVGEHAVRLPLQQMLRFKGGDVRDCREDVARMSGGTLDAIPMVDATLSCLGIDVKVLEMVVEINRAGTEVSPQKSGMGGEDGRNVNSSDFHSFT